MTSNQKPQDLPSDKPKPEQAPPSPTEPQASAAALPSIPAAFDSNETANPDSARQNENNTGTSGSSLYAGEIINGVRYGTGTIRYPGGEIYEGELKDGLRHGQGTLTRPNGEKYTGEWKDDNISGYGIYRFADGAVYDGEWRDNLRFGQGKFSWPNGASYEGAWKDDLRNGYGTYRFPDGDKYTGEWRNDLFNGYGTITAANGEKLKDGMWEDGVFKYWPRFNYRARFLPRLVGAAFGRPFLRIPQHTVKYHTRQKHTNLGFAQNPYIVFARNEFGLDSAGHACAQRIRAVLAPNSLNNNLFFSKLLTS